MRLNKEEIKKVAEMKRDDACNEMRSRYFGRMNYEFYALFKAAKKNNEKENAKYEIELEVDCGKCGYGAVVIAKSNNETIEREFDNALDAMCYVVSLRQFEKEYEEIVEETAEETVVEAAEDTAEEVEVETKTAKRGRPFKYTTDEERKMAHLRDMQKYLTRKINGEEIRPYGVYTEQEKHDRHLQAMKRYQLKKRD